MQYEMSVHINRVSQLKEHCEKLEKNMEHFLA